MTLQKTFASVSAVAIGFVVAIPLAGVAPRRAHAGPDGHDAPAAFNWPADCRPMPPPEWGPPPGGDREWGGTPPFLAGLALTEEQQDKVFGILHAAAPEVREQTKALRKAHEALADLATSAQYEEGRAKQRAEGVARADREFTLLRARTEHEIFMLLNAQQRAQLLDRHREQHADGRGGPPVP